MLTVMSVFLILMLTYCKKDDDDNNISSQAEVKYDATLYDFQPGPFSMPDFKDNPPTIEGVKLGRMLFYEKMLSKDNSQSCATCHKQENGFSDPDRFSIGVEGQPGKRQAMSVFNTAWHQVEFFWDGRAHLLRDQSLMPIQDPLEMNETLENVIAKLSESQMYKDQFKRAFDSEEITAEKMSLAMEQFMNTIVSYSSKYDKYKAGEVQLTASEQRGMRLFNLEYNEFRPNESGADCQHCHSNNNFDFTQYVNNGLDKDGEFIDLGREEVTGDPADRGKFKVPSLRNIELTAPYMHDGRFNTLEEVIDHYDHGIKISPSLDPALLYTTNTGLRLTSQDKADLIAFLKTFTDHSLATDERYSDPFKE